MKLQMLQTLVKKVTVVGVKGFKLKRRSNNVNKLNPFL